MPEHERQCRDHVDISFCLEGHETGASWPQASSYRGNEAFRNVPKPMPRRGLGAPADVAWSGRASCCAPAYRSAKDPLPSPAAGRMCPAAVRAAALRALPRRLKL
jgi:hypothetical protein